MSEVDVVAASSRGSVLAAAGCGKTELIVRTVEALSQGHQLILTHTNAGVHALRQRLLRKQVPNTRFTVDTLDGWCLRFVKAYPARAQVNVESDVGEVDWAALRQGMLTLLKLAFVRRVVRLSYSGALVDEYQDCNTFQHALVSELSSILPTRVFGDPMQAIFGFGGNKLVEWNDVNGPFPSVVELKTPMRWQQPGANKELGTWLSQIRPTLEAHKSVVLDDTPVEWVGLEGRALVEVVAESANITARKCKMGERLVVLWKWPRSCHDMAMRTSGYFQCVEPIDSKEGRAALRQIVTLTGLELVSSVLDFAGICCTHITQKLRTDLLGWVKGAGRGSRNTNVRVLVEQLRRVAGGEPGSIPDALKAISNHPEVRTYRRELFYAVLDSLHDAAKEAALTPLAAFSRRRQATSRSGRRLALRSVGTPLLLKGLEFEHVILADEGKMSARELYVALTRATRSLTVVGSAERLTPSG